MAAALTILFGALPASFLSYFAGVAIYAGAMIITDTASIAPGLFLMLWGSAGIYGTISLWFAAFQRFPRPVVAGLIVGLLAICPLTMSAIQELVFLDIGYHQLILALVISPSVAASVWLARLYFEHRSASTDDSAKPLKS